MWARLFVASLLCVSLGSEAFGLQEDEQDDKQEVAEIVAQIRLLRAQIEQVLQGLSPELRSEVERELTQAPDPRVSDPQVSDPDASHPPTPDTTVLEQPTVAASAHRACDGLRFFDSNQDNVLTAADRYWRHFFVWVDEGDGRMSDEEVRSVFEAGVRQIRLDLRGYTTDGGGVGHVEVGERVRLDVVVRRRRGVQTGWLVVDAGRLARAGELRLIGPAGQELEGRQLLQAGMIIEAEGGKREPFLCR